MNSNLSIQPGYKPSFGISVSEGFIKAAHNYYNGVEYRPWRAEVFDKKVAQVFNEFGYDEFIINYKKVIKDGKTSHILSAVNGDMEVPLTSKDQFRKVIEKFQRLTKGELYVKIKDFRTAHPEFNHRNG